MFGRLLLLLLVFLILINYSINQIIKLNDKFYQYEFYVENNDHVITFLINKN